MFIFVTSDSELASRHPLEPGETLVGRAPNCRILINHGSVSRAHARFFVQEELCTLEDRGSLNGTFVNGVLINTAQIRDCLLYTSPSPRDGLLSRMPSSA